MDDRRAFLTAQCGHITDGAQQVGCMAEKSIEFSRARTEAAKKRIEETQQAISATKNGIADEAVLRTCLTYLQQQRAGGKTFDRTITRDNACAYARELGLRGGPG